MGTTITNRGDRTTITLECGVAVVYDAPHLRRLTGNDQARAIGALIEDAITKFATGTPPPPVWWMDKGRGYMAPKPEKPQEATAPESDYVPSGLANEDEIMEE